MGQKNIFDGIFDPWAKISAAQLQMKFSNLGKFLVKIYSFFRQMRLKVSHHEHASEKNWVVYLYFGWDLMIFFRRRRKNLEGFFVVEVEKICHKKVTKLFTKDFTCPSPSLFWHPLPSPGSFFQGAWGIGGSSPHDLSPPQAEKFGECFGGEGRRKSKKIVIKKPGRNP